MTEIVVGVGIYRVPILCFKVGQYSTAANKTFKWINTFPYVHILH